MNPAIIRIATPRNVLEWIVMPNFYQMRGRDTLCAPALQPAWVHWTVQDTPDFTAARCPAAAMICGTTPTTELTDITVANEWTTDYSWPTARILHVGQDPRMYRSVTDAIAAIPLLAVPPSVNNRLTVMVWPGKYTTSSVIDVPAYVGIKGISATTVIFQNDVTSLFRAAGSFCFFEDFMISGSPTAGLYALDMNNQNNVEIRRVNMLNNGGAARQLFLKQSGATWKTMFVQDCIVDGYQASGELCLLENTSTTASRDVDTHFTNAFFDVFHLSATGGCMKVRGLHGLYLRVGSLFRGVGANFTGVRLEKAGVLAGTPATEIHDSVIVGNAPAASVRTEVGTNWVSVNAYLASSVFAGTHLEFNSTI
jgi:hypothetical protein